MSGMKVRHFLDTQDFSREELLAEQLGAHRLLMLTDVDAVYGDFGPPSARAIRLAPAGELARMNSPAGSMGQKLAAACRFARSGMGSACIGRLNQVSDILAGRAGTTIIPGGTRELA